MDDFITAGTALKDALPETEAAAWPSALAWEERRRSFAAAGAERPACVPVTVNARQPLAPYGEEPGFFKRLFRRVLRRCVRWYAEPLVQQQNEVNRALLEEIRRLEERLQSLEDEIRA